MAVIWLARSQILLKTDCHWIWSAASTRSKYSREKNTGARWQGIKMWAGDPADRNCTCFLGVLCAFRAASSLKNMLFCLFRASLAYVHLREQRSCGRQTGCLWEDEWEGVNLTRKFVHVPAPLCVRVCINPRKDFLWFGAAWEFCGSSRHWHGKKRKRERRKEREGEVQESERDQGQ